MKKIMMLCLLCLYLLPVLDAQEVKDPRVPMLGETAPGFSAESTAGIITFPDNNISKWTILLSHPADFTPVCSSELLELAFLQEDFEKLNARLMVISTDAVSSHIEWVRSLESVNYKNRGTVKIKFPLISDKMLDISKKYGMIHSKSSTTKDIRGVYIIDPDNKIQAMLFYPMNIGRNMEEVKRTLVALQTAEKFDVNTPANWTPGQDVLIHSPETSAEAEKLKKEQRDDLYSLTWYMWFKKLK